MTTASPIERAVRYIDPEVLNVVFATELDSVFGDDIDLENIDPDALRTEITASVAVDCEVAEMAGWSVTSNLVDTPDLCSRFTGQIEGRVTSDDSSITFYADLESTTVQDLLPRGQRGHILLFDQGDPEGEMPTEPSGKVFDAFPVVVSAVSKSRSVEGSNAKTIMVSFAITQEPVENIEVPPHETGT